MTTYTHYLRSDDSRLSGFASLPGYSYSTRGGVPTLYCANEQAAHRIAANIAGEGCATVEADGVTWYFASQADADSDHRAELAVAEVGQVDAEQEAGQ